MEIAGLAIGIVSLYKVTDELLSGLDAYKNFGIESEATLLNFEGIKIRLEDWANGVGIRNGSLADNHDHRLEDPRRASILKDALNCIRKVFDKVEYTKSSINIPKRQRSAGNGTWTTPYDEPNDSEYPKQSLSKRSRLAWAAGGREKLNKDILVFEKVVNVLYHVVSPTNTSTDHRFHVSGSENARESLSDLDVNLKNVQEKVDALDRREIFEWLDAVKDDDEHEKHMQSHLSGTCEWILDHPAYLGWIIKAESGTATRFLWINGPAGFGKTILSAWLINHLQASLKLPVAYCFSSSHVQTTNAFDDVVRTWITQMAQISSDVLRVCQKMHQNQSARRASRNVVWTLLREISLQCTSLVFAIDGLDEFSTKNDARSRFLQDVKNAVASTGVKVMVTSRNEVDIGSEISPSATCSMKHLMLECVVTKESVKSDIHLYSQSKVAQKLPGHNKDFRQDIAVKMAENAGGMFLLIKLQQSHLRGSQNQKTIRGIVQGMPQGLHQTYERDWRSIIQEQGEHDRDRAIRILRWLTFGYTALTVGEMSEALIIELDNLDEAFDKDDLPMNIDAEYSNKEIKGLCRSLIEIRLEGGDPDSPLNTIHLVHASVREYLVTVLPISTPFASVQNSEQLYASNHAMLTKYCLRFLNSHAAWAESDDGSSPAFLSYAVVSWVEHLRDAEEYHYDSLAHVVLEFMDKGNTNFAQWQTKYETATYGWWTDVEPQNNPSVMYYASLLGILPLMDHIHTCCDEDINSVGGHFETPLQAVCALGCEPAFDRLLSWGADSTIEGGRFHTALNAAAIHGSYRMVNALIVKDIQEDRLRAQRQEALESAAKEGHIDIVELFLEHNFAVAHQHGYDLDQSKVLSNSLLFAAIQGHAAIVEMLLEYGADMASRNEFSDTALHIAAQFNHVGVARALILKGASLELVGFWGSPIHDAAECGNLEMLSELSERGASIVSRGHGGNTPLHRAAFHGFADVVAFLLSHGAEINAQNEGGDTALTLALEKHNQQTLDILFEYKADVSIADTEDWGPIHYAARHGLVDTMSILIEKGADLNARTKLGSSPLHIGVRHAHKAVAQLLLRLGAKMMPDCNGRTPFMLAAKVAEMDLLTQLLEAGADINSRDKWGATPLYIAIQPRDEEKDQDRLQVVKFLLDHGASCSATDRGVTPLARAAGEGHNAIFELLLDRGHNLDTIANDGWTSLHLAAFNGHVEIVTILLNRRPEVKANANDSDGWTPLHFAAFNGHVEIVTILLNRRPEVKVNAKINDGSTPLHFAASNGHVEIVTILLDRRPEVDVNANDSDGWTPLHLAASKGHVEIVTNLLDRGHDLDVAIDRNDGRTALHLAAQNGHKEVVTVLLNRGYNLNAADNGGRYPLHYAAREGHNEIVVFLLDRGHRVDVTDNDGWTPLHFAASKGYDEVVTSLLDRKHNVNARAHSGETPLWLAASESKIDVARLLLRRGADADLSDDYGETPLYIALGERDIGLAHDLVATGCSINVEAPHRDTALRMAIVTASDELILQLIQRGADLGATRYLGLTCLHWLKRLRPHLLHSQMQRKELEDVDVDHDSVILGGTICKLATDLRAASKKQDYDLFELFCALLLLGMEEDARLAWQAAYVGEVKWTCDLCRLDRTLEQSYSICKTCVGVGLCPDCMGKHVEKPVFDLCRDHEFLEVVAAEAKIRPDQTEAFDEWLLSIQERFQPSKDGENTPKLSALSIEPAMNEEMLEITIEQQV